MYAQRRERESGNSKRPEMKEQTCERASKYGKKRLGSRMERGGRRRMKQNKRIRQE